MTDLRIRRFENGDGQAVRALHEQALRDAGDFAEDVDEPDLEDVCGHYLESDGEFLVGTIDGEIVAMVAYHPVAEWILAERFTFDRTTAEVTRLRVDPDHQGEGYGRAICDELERRARQAGYEQLVLDVSEHNQCARSFYEARGYEYLRTEVIEIPQATFRLATYRKRFAE